MPINSGQEERSDVPRTGLSSRDILIMEEERRRLARELHDGPVQALTSMSMRLEVCRQLSLRNDFAPLQDELAQLKLEFERSIHDLRDLTGEWRLPPLNEDSLREAMDHYVREYAARTGIEVKVDLRDLPDDRLYRTQKVAIFRILQEALRNTSRHSGASEVWITAALKPENLRVSIKDNGKGFNLLSATANYPRQGLGLVGMQERVKALGGELEIDSQPGQGTNIMLIIPSQGLKGQYGEGSETVAMS
jgi:two-component system sensor histidine kinase DegS